MERCVFCQGELNPITQLCRNCGSVQPTLDRFTPAKPPETPIMVSIGESSVSHCPNCQQITRTQANFCPTCGYRLRPLKAPVEKADAEDLKSTFKEKLIDWKNMSPFLRVLLYGAFMQIGVVALLLLTKNIAQSQVNSAAIDATGKPYVVSITVFIVMAISIGVGYWFALAGAFYVHWSVRLPVVLLATGLLAITPVTTLINIATYVRVGSGPTTIEGWLRITQLAILAIFWLWAIQTSLRERRGQRGIAKHTSNQRGGYVRPFIVVLVLLLVYYGLELVVWLLYKYVGITASGTTFFLQPFGVQALLLVTVLSLLVIMGSTDLLEWGEILADNVVTFTKHRRAPWLLLSLTLLASIYILVHVLLFDGGQILLELLIGVGLVGIAALLIRFAQIGPDWPTEIPSSTVLILAVFLYIYGTVSSSIGSTISDARGLSQTSSAQFYAIMSMPVAIAGLTIGLFLMMRGRAGNTILGAIGLGLSMLVVLVGMIEGPPFLSVLGLSVAYPASHFFLLDGVQMLLAFGTLIWIVSLIMRPKILDEATEQLSAVFLLLIGLQIVFWVNGLLKLIANLQGISTVLLAGLFLLTILWSLVTSGKSVTNTDSPRFPREGRTLLFLGYTLIANATLLYLGTLAVQGAPNASIPDYLTNDYVTLGALVVIGPPLVTLGFLLRMSHSTSRSLMISSSQPPKKISSRSTQFGILGGGALLTVLLLIFVPVYLLSRPVRANTPLLNQPYSTTHPGPGCDTNGAIWLAPRQPISTSCRLNGLQITVPAHLFGGVLFEPPSRTFPQNYRVSVQLIDSTISSGCVYIEMRASGVSYYEDTLCRAFNGSIILGGITLMHNGRSTILTTKVVIPAKTYTIEATTDGTIQRIAINGVVVTSISNATLTRTGFIAFGVSNSGTKDATSVFSNFIFTPLA